MARRRIFTLGGGGFSMEPDNPALDDFLLSISRNPARPKVCFVPTASGDNEGYVAHFRDSFSDGRAEPSVLCLFPRQHADLREFVLAQDVVYVGGGSTANLLAVWRTHGLDRILKEAYDEGVVLAGISAGMNCWFEASVTDSFGPDLAPLHDGLGFLAGSACPHYDGEELRAGTYRGLVADGFPSGHAADDGCGLLFEDGELADVVCSRPKADAYYVSDGPDGPTERPLGARYLGEG
jgi:dipeptidase E